MLRTKRGNLEIRNIYDCFSVEKQLPDLLLMLHFSVFFSSGTVWKKKTPTTTCCATLLARRGLITSGRESALGLWVTARGP